MVMYSFNLPKGAGIYADIVYFPESGHAGSGILAITNHQLSILWSRSLWINVMERLYDSSVSVGKLSPPKL